MLPVVLFYASLVNDVRTLLANRDLAAAEKTVRSYEARSGATSEAAAAVSWLARAELAAKDYPKADAYAAESRQIADKLLLTRKLDSDQWLPVAIGASIEVHAQVLAAQGERSEAVAGLRREVRTFGATSIAERIQKNLNLLSLEGKPAPPLDTAHFLDARPPSLSALRGHAVLLFFWAHWCPDCKAEAPILARLERIYGPKGLVLIEPTKLYGYVEGGEPASPATEMKYIEKIRKQFYAELSPMAVPLGEDNFQRYGASTTPTLVLIDGRGTVQLYYPGALPAAELAARIQSVLGK